ncbi:MAG TPA: chorismate-binding protein [Candidatus Gracilibacteria bacterium]
MKFELAKSEDEGLALIKRAEDPYVLEFRGPVHEIDQLDQIPSPTLDGHNQFQTLNLVPFRQVAERGFETHDEGTPLLSMRIAEQVSHDVNAVIRDIPVRTIEMGPIEYDLEEAEYEARIAAVIRDEIGRGEGANFVIPRRGRSQIDGMDHAQALNIFRNLLEGEKGAYWTFLFYAQGRYLIGATPERHITLENNQVSMNPISGTYRKNETPPTKEEALAHLLRFVQDEKEIHELFMVVDEELKQMARICSEGGAVIGPMLKDMSRLMHTEYVLKGRTSRSVQEVLRDSMFAATVTGSPIESACRVIRKYEPGDRRYYASTLALVGEQHGKPYLDSPILIRTVEIDDQGALEFRVGGSLVRDSDPHSEMLETCVKSSGVLSAVSGNMGEADYPQLDAIDPAELEATLEARNADLSQFWLQDQGEMDLRAEALRGKKIIIIDGEDDFSHMLGHIICRFGATVDIVRHEDYKVLEDDADITILGPGPGDPTNTGDRKIVKMARFARRLMDRDKKLLGICLGHQIIAQEMGFRIQQRETPQQGVPKDIDFFGAPKRVGFYNTFTAKIDPNPAPVTLSDGDSVIPNQNPYGAALAMDEDGSINALKRGRTCGLQFHPESILSKDGVDILREVLLDLLDQ